MVQQYWISKDGKPIGPLTASQVCEQASPDSWVSLEGKWVAFRNHPDFQKVSTVSQVPQPPPAVDSEKQQVEAHLQFHGYKTSWNQDGTGLFATHARFANALVLFSAAGIVHFARWNSKHRSSELPHILIRTNALAEALHVQRVWIDKDLNLCEEATYVGSYDRTRYGLFLDLWHQDFQTIFADQELVASLS